MQDLNLKRRDDGDILDFRRFRVEKCIAEALEGHRKSLWMSKKASSKAENYCCLMESS